MLSMFRAIVYGTYTFFDIFHCSVCVSLWHVCVNILRYFLCFKPDSATLLYSYDFEEEEETEIRDFSFSTICVTLPFPLLPTQPAILPISATSEEFVINIKVFFS